jgi:hypothetical protein
MTTIMPAGGREIRATRVLRRAAYRRELGFGAFTSPLTQLPTTPIW